MNKNNPLNIFLTASGCVLIILALVLSKAGMGEMAVYSTFTAGVLLEFVYKLRVVLEHKKQGESYVRDLIVCGIYILMVVAVLLF